MAIDKALASRYPICADTEEKKMQGGKSLHH